MTILIENPIPLIFFAVAIEAILGVVLYITGRGVFLVAMMGVLILLLGGIALEWWIVTERERVEETLEEVRAAVEANDAKRVLRCISSQAGNIRTRAEREMKELTFTSVKITDRKIGNVNELTSPPEIVGRFIARVSVQDHTGNSITKPVKFSLTFRLENDRWVITEYSYDGF